MVFRLFRSRRALASGMLLAGSCLVVGTFGVSGVAWAADDDQFKSETEIRLMEMESRFRTVTGQYEEAMYRLTQMNRTLESTLADVEYRLQQLEQGAAPTPAVADTTTTEVIEAPVDNSDAGAEVEHTAAVPEEVAQEAPPPEQFLEGDTPEDQYANAFALVRRNELDKAIVSLGAFVSLYPDHKLRANAAYWLGRSHAAKKDFGEAARILVDAYDKHANSDKGAEILLHLGLSLGSLGQNEDACSAFGELERRYTDLGNFVKESMINGQKKAGCL